MASEELEMINELLRAQDFASLSLEEQRAAVEGGIGQVPTGTVIDPIDAGGVACEWIRTPDAGSATTIVSLRGGGYCLGSLHSNRWFSSLLSESVGGRVLNVGYPNAPEHRFPAALDSVLAAYRWLVADTDPATIAIVGNSAGGGLTLATLLALRDAGDPLPACAVAISPWTDLTNSGDSIQTNAATEVMLDAGGIDETATLYADAEQLREPYVSPLWGDLSGLPPILLHASSSELLLDDSTRFAERAATHGADVTLEVTDGVPHVWHTFGGFLPEADEAMARLGSWVSARLADR
ncbi:MAG: alpha/beta hydrolase [Acidimicrobiales bacterium]